MLSDAQRAALAARLRQRRAEPVLRGPAGAVRLNDGPVERRLVLFHAISGTVHPYGHLALELAGDFEVWGLPAPPGQPTGTGSLQALIQLHLQVLRQLQPAGPYRLGGWSMGGILAYEIARILLAEGQQVLAVGLFDSPFWLPAELPEQETVFVSWFVNDAARTLDTSAGVPPDPAGASVEQQLDWLAERLGGSTMRAEVEQRYQAFRANTEMLAGYRPSGPLDSDLLIIKVEESPNMTELWQAITNGKATTLAMAGNHYSFLQPPAVREVADASRAVFHPVPMHGGVS
jgi:thioesterase domain-containing protein